MKARYVTFGVCSVLVSIAGCSSNVDDGSPEAAPQSATSASSSSGSTTTTTPSTSRCTVGGMDIAISDEGGAAAGSVTLNLTFHNKTDSACTLTGFPGVSYAYEANSAPVGRPADRDGESFGTITLAPDATVTSFVRAVNVLNFPVEECEPVSVGGFTVYPPENTEKVYLPYPTTGCSNETARQLSVTAVSGS